MSFVVSDDSVEVDVWALLFYKFNNCQIQPFPQQIPYSRGGSLLPVWPLQREARAPSAVVNSPGPGSARNVNQVTPIIRQNHQKPANSSK